MVKPQYVIFGFVIAAAGGLDFLDYQAILIG